LVDPTSELGRKVSTVAKQLRVLHAELYDESTDLRQQQIGDRIRTVSDVLPAAEKRPFLEALMTEFPVWSSGDGTVVPAAAAPRSDTPGAGNEKLIAELKAAQAEAAALRAEIADPWALADRLRQHVAKMDGESRTRLGQLLSQAGVSIPAAPGAAGGGGGLDAAAERELKAKLGMAAGQHVSVSRLAELQMLEVDFLASLEQFSWAAWTRMASQSKYRRLGPLIPTLGKFVAGEAGVGKPEVEKQLTHVRKLILALVAGVSRVAGKYSRQHFAKFAVPAIESVVKVGAFGNKPAACWQKYSELMQGIDEATLEAELSGIVAEEVETLLGGSR
jgi:hypothetical protein